jgi:hypothetical protein
VEWKHCWVCKSKNFLEGFVFSKEGRRLGVEEFGSLESFSMLRHVWSLFARSGSIWVAWVKENYLRRKSFWSVNIPQNCSWS